MGDENKEEITPRSADFSGETQRYPMDGNSNCTAWCRWETYRVYRDGQPGWDCRFIINATKTNTYPTYGQGRVQAGVKGHAEGTLEEKYIEIVAGETRTFYDQAVFVRAENENDIQLTAYANLLIPNVVSKGMEFLITVKRNLWGVYFDANGGSGAPDMIKRHWGEIVYIPTTVPYKSGYTFKGWTKSKGSATVDYKPGDPIGDDFDVTLYAVWSQNVVKTWSITYNANGGTGAPARQTANVGQSITITSSRPTRSGYTFLGWATWSSATYAEYQPGSRLQSDYDMTLYAVWQQNQSTQYSLSFNLQGGTGTFNTLYGEYGDSVQIPYTKPTKSGYTFKGWATYAGGNASYQPGEYYTLYQNSTLYAVWQTSGGGTGQYKLEFDLQGGSGSFPAMYGNYGSRVQIPDKLPIKSNSTFLGWSDTQNGNVYYYPGDYYMLYGNATIYAIWESNSSPDPNPDPPPYPHWRIEYDANGGTNAPATQYAALGQPIVITTQKPTRDEYTFLGWSESKYATVPDPEVAPGVSCSGWGYDMRLYAVWEEDSSRMYLGYDSIGKIYIGNRQVTAAYIGTTKIW